MRPWLVVKAADLNSRMSIRQRDADHYEQIAEVPTAYRAKRQFVFT
jgi:hypothetical protein